MSTTQLRPLGIGEILDVAIKAYTKNARTLIAIGAIVGVPFELLSGVIKLSTLSSASQVSGFTIHANMVNDYSRARIAGLVVTGVIALVVNLLLTASTVKAVSDGYLGGVPSVRDSLRFALRRIRSLAWLYLLLGVTLTLATIALVIPAIWLYVAWSVATPVLLIEDIRGTTALRRSFRLVRGRWWPTAGLLLVTTIIVVIFTSVLTGLLVVIPHLIDDSSVLLAVIASTIVGALATAVVRPLQGAIITILYFDLRVRKEGFDLSLLAARLGLPEARIAASWLPEGHLTRPAQGGLDPHGDAPPFWPPPPGWKPARPPAPPGRTED